MEKAFVNCEHWFTPQCQQYDNPIMKKIYGQQKTNAINYFSNTDVGSANNLCKDCDSFVFES